MRVLVTGGTSLLGATTADLLIARGDEVVMLQRSRSSADCTQVLGDVRDPEVVTAAVRGCDAVIHLAAKVGITGSYRDYAAVNIDGTANVVDAAVKAGVTRFVHVSSPSVAHSGSALAGAGADAARPDAARSAYSRTKAYGEIRALSADAPGFAVIALRPHLVWGPGDTQLVGRIVARARKNRLFLIGDGCALIDSTYLDNAAEALVAGLDRAPRAHGKAFVVSNGQPRPIADLLSGIARAAGADVPRRRIGFRAAQGAGYLAQGVWTLLRRPDDPPITSFLAEQMGTAHWFDQRAVRKELEWEPRIGIEEGFVRLAQWYAAHP